MNMISLFLRNISMTFPNTGISSPSSTTILERQSMMVWKVTYDVYASVLTLTVPTNIDPRVLLFEFGGNYGIVLPSYGIAADTIPNDYKSNYSSSNFLVNIGNSLSGNYLIGIICVISIAIATMLINSFAPKVMARMKHLTSISSIKTSS